MMTPLFYTILNENYFKFSNLFKIDTLEMESHPINSADYRFHFELPTYENEIPVRHVNEICNFFYSIEKSHINEHIQNLKEDYVNEIITRYQNYKYRQMRRFANENGIDADRLPVLDTYDDIEIKSAWLKPWIERTSLEELDSYFDSLDDFSEAVVRVRLLCRFTNKVTIKVRDKNDHVPLDLKDKTTSHVMTIERDLKMDGQPLTSWKIADFDGLLSTELRSIKDYNLTNLNDVLSNIPQAVLKDLFN